MNNKEHAELFLKENKQLLEEVVNDLLQDLTFDEEEEIHIVHETNEIFTTKMLDQVIANKISEYNEFSYRKKWLINNKVYFMLLPEEVRERRLVEHKKKVNKMRIKNLNKKKYAKQKAKKAKKPIKGKIEE